MSLLWLAAKRSRVRVGLLASLLAVVAVVTLLLAATICHLVSSADATVRHSLAAGPPTSAAVQLQARLADDPAEQSATVEAIIAKAFAGVAVESHRTLRSNPALVMTDDSLVAPMIFATDPGVAEHSELVVGEWSAAPGSIAIQANAAAELGLQIGDKVLLAERAFTVTATWMPKDATDPYWFGDSAVASGFASEAIGPLLVSEADLTELPLRSYADWTVIPDAAQLGASDLPSVTRALKQLQKSLDQLGDTDSIDLVGGLGERVTTLQRGLGVARGLITVPLVLVGLIGIITIAQLARLLATVRRGETGLLRARGASVAQLTFADAIAAAFAVILGSTLGAIAAIALLVTGVITSAANASTDVVGALQSSWPVALATAAIALAVCTVVAWRAAATSSGTESRGDSGRSTSSATVGLTLLALAAAGVSMWQFKFYGSPLMTGDDGSIRVDPLTVLAPAASLLAMAMLGLLAFGPLVSLVQRVAARSRGIFPVLPSRQVARRVSVFSVAVLLVTLSVSGTTLAAGYASTWSAANEQSAGLRNGADVRVKLSPPAAIENVGSLVTGVPYANIKGARAVAPVLTTDAQVGDDTVTLTALDAAAIPAVMLSADNAVDLVSLATMLKADRVGIELSAASGIELSVTAKAPGSQKAGLIDTSAWIVDAAGSLAKVAVGSASLAAATSAPVDVSAELPVGLAPWRLLAVEATLSGAASASRVEVTVSGAGEPRTLSLASKDPTARASTFDAMDALPIVVTETLKARVNLKVGDQLSVRLPSTASTVNAVVAGTVSLLPGTTNTFGIAADLTSLYAYLLQSSERIPQLSEVWISTATRDAVVAKATSISRTPASITTLQNGSTEALVSPAVSALWWGMAGALLLAVIAILAITTTLAESRRGEVVVLRTLGMSSRDQGTNRLIELGAVVGAAMLFGVLTGLVTSYLSVGELAGTAAAASVIPAISFEYAGWLWMVGATLAALIVIALWYARRVRVQALDTEYREETR